MRAVTSLNQGAAEDGKKGTGLPVQSQTDSCELPEMLAVPHASMSNGCDRI